MGHKTRSKWKNKQESGTTNYTATTIYNPKQYSKPAILGSSPTFDFPIKRIKRTAGILLILAIISWLLYAFKIF